MGRLKRTTGFTIVELLIVIVIIGILAAITIIAYNGVQKRAQGSAASAALSQSSKKLALYHADNGVYPSSLATAGVSDGNNISYQYTQTNAGASYCVTATSGNVSYMITPGLQPTAGGCPGDYQNGYVATSCLAILNAGYSSGDGIYKIRPSGAPNDFNVYCDMTNSGGGWTLIVSNPGPHTVWNMTTIYTLNESAPSIAAPYSILSKADSIKSNIGGKLRYKIDAVTPGRWGGVWEAPYTNTFTGTSPVNNATIIEKYDTWNQDDTPENGTQSLTTVMPWVKDTVQLLSTWGNVNNWYGTLVTGQSGWGPAPYMQIERVAPGKIWYWVR